MEKEEKQENEIELELKVWGSSLGAIVDSKFVKMHKLKKGDMLLCEVKKIWETKKKEKI